MPWHSIFGGVLRSDLVIDELPPAAGGSTPDWEFLVADGPPPEPGDPLGEDVVFGDVKVRGCRSADGFSLVFDDTGRFDVSPAGRTIRWYRPPGVSVPSAMADLTSRVLALALHAAGTFSLHASAVSVAGGGLAFLGPKHHGKSTLCSAMVLAGARAMSDDTVPVRPGAVPTLVPGLPRLRLWNDSAGRLFGFGEGGAAPTRKYLLDELRADQVETRVVPLQAIYVLHPVATNPDNSPVRRERQDPVMAAMSLVVHAKLGPILTGGESEAMLGHAAAIAGVVPVYTLHVVRDLSRLDEVARTLREWHTPAGTEASPGRDS